MSRGEQWKFKYVVYLKVGLENTYKLHKSKQYWLGKQNVYINVAQNAIS